MVGGVTNAGDGGGELEYDGDGVRSRSSAKWTRFLGAIVWCSVQEDVVVKV